MKRNYQAILRVFILLLCCLSVACVVYQREVVPPAGEVRAPATPEEPTLATPAAPETVSSQPADPFTDLIGRIDARFSDTDFAHAHWGVLIQSLATEKVWYQHNANRLFMPASNQKILTTAAALRALGPDFKFETALCYRGEVSTPTIEGDLVVFGNGDPTLYERFHKDSRDVFRKWASELKAHGITRITGDIIGDDDAFDDEHIGYGWSLDNLSSWYSAEYGALQLNENYIDVKIIPPETVDGSVTVEPNLPSSYYTIENSIEVVEQGRNRVRMYRAQNTNLIELSGTVVAGSRAFERSPTITNPTLFYVTVLKEVLEEEGISVEGEPRDCDDLEGWEHKPDDFPRLATHYSPSLSEILTGLMKRSQNMYAETMVRVLGWYHTGLGSFRAGREVVEDELSSLGVTPGTYAFRDGSGLCRYNFISPRQLVDILRGMRRHEHGQVWVDTLPIAGVDGTLRRRMKGTPAEGNVRAKTGTISNVRGLSGYVTTADGEELVFSFLVNAHLRSNRANELITDDVLAMLASFDREGAATE